MVAHWWWLTGGAARVRPACAQAVLRLLYSYLMGRPRTEATRLEIPLHTVIKITYDGWNPPREERFTLGPDPKDLEDDGQKHL